MKLHVRVPSNESGIAELPKTQASMKSPSGKVNAVHEGSYSKKLSSLIEKVQKALLAVSNLVASIFTSRSSSSKNMNDDFIQMDPLDDDFYDDDAPELSNDDLEQKIKLTT